VANAVAECVWLCQLLVEFGYKVDMAAIVYCDSVSAVYMASNLLLHKAPILSWTFNLSGNEVLFVNSELLIYPLINNLHTLWQMGYPQWSLNNSCPVCLFVQGTMYKLQRGVDDPLPVSYI